MSFNDLLTVLLTFFILLVSVSTFHMDKVQGASSSAVETFGAAKQQSNTYTDLIKTINNLEGLQVQPIEGGISIILPESLLYRSGSAEIIQRDLLKTLSAKLKTISATIRIEGHTDNVPVSNPAFPSNWELSIQRAANVAKFMIQECGIDPSKMSVAGYADSRPVAPNDTAEGQALNRRVNMIISLK